MTIPADHSSTPGATGKPWKDKSDIAGQMAVQIERVRSRMASVRHSVAVMSGKGGVGKSTVTAGLAVTLARLGFAVGVCDLDINGPSIPTLLGMSGKMDFTDPKPIVGVEGIKVVSSDFLLDDERMPIRWNGPVRQDAIWRGSLEMTVARELIGDVEWGELDIMLFDLPPGTSDKLVVVAQLLGELSGAMVVSTPSSLAHHVVRKSIAFAQGLDIPLLGIVLNMSHLVCPTCDTTMEFLGPDETAEGTLMGLPVLARLPFDHRGFLGRGSAMDTDRLDDAFGQMASNLHQALDYKAAMADRL